MGDSFDFLAGSGSAFWMDPPIMKREDSLVIISKDFLDFLNLLLDYSEN